MAETRCKAFYDVPKKRGSTKTTANGALLVAVGASSIDWKIEGYETGIRKLYVRQQLRERLSVCADERRTLPHESMGGLLSAGVFSGIDVETRRGYWRVVFYA